MIKTTLAAALVTGLLAGMTQAQAAARPTHEIAVTSPVQSVHWVRNRFGRLIWVPGPRYPVFYPHRRWDRWHHHGFR